MAQTTIVQTTDDLDGSKDAQTVRFSFDDAEYTIDLSRKNKAAFEKALKPYIEAGTKVKRRSRTAAARTKGSRRDLAEVRAWAKSNGYAVSERGRIAGDVIAAYDAAP